MGCFHQSMAASAGAVFVGSPCPVHRTKGCMMDPFPGSISGSWHFCHLKKCNRRESNPGRNRFRRKKGSIIPLDHGCLHCYPAARSGHLQGLWQPWSNGQDSGPPSQRPGFDSRRLHLCYKQKRNDEQHKQQLPVLCCCTQTPRYFGLPCPADKHSVANKRWT